VAENFLLYSVQTGCTCSSFNTRLKLIHHNFSPGAASTLLPILYNVPCREQNTYIWYCTRTCTRLNVLLYTGLAPPPITSMLSIASGDAPADSPHGPRSASTPLVAPDQPLAWNGRTCAVALNRASLQASRSPGSRATNGHGFTSRPPPSEHRYPQKCGMSSWVALTSTATYRRSSRNTRHTCIWATQG
jgi:hypothetical protein